MEVSDGGKGPHEGAAESTFFISPWVVSL